MAHFAELNSNNIVVNVIKLDDAVTIGDLPFPDSEVAGINFLNTIIPGKIWKQTSYNNNFRFRYPGIGYEYHSECGEYGGFCPPKPFDDWVFDYGNCLWIAPKPMPLDSIEKIYVWDATIHDWKLFENE